VSGAKTPFTSTKQEKEKRMKKVIKRKIDMGDRVVQIGTNPELAPTAGITALFTQVATTTSTLKEWAMEQSGGLGTFRGGALECRRLAGELRASMRDISEIARVLKPEVAPGAKEVFRMPRNRSFQALLAAGRHFAEKAQPLEALFTARALPATFIADLQAQITAFETAVGMKAGGRSERVGGTSGLDVTARSLIELVQELRAIMRVHLKAKPALLEAFRTAARVERSGDAAVVEAPVAATPESGSGGTGTAGS
jgi:hypothetical protein